MLKKNIKHVLLKNKKKTLKCFYNCAPNGISIISAIFAQFTAECPYLTMGRVV